MWRGFAVFVLIALLLVSAGGNVFLYQESAAARSEARALGDRVRSLLDERATASARLSGTATESLATPQVPAPMPGTVPTSAVRPGGATNPAPSGTPAVPAAAGPEAGVLTRIESQVSQIRGLRPQREVALKFMDSNALRQYFVQSFDAEYSPDERESDQKLLTTLGLLEPSQSLLDILLDLLTEQVVGSYDTDDQTMYVISNQQGFDVEQQATFAHELVHALQDQYYDLDVLSPKDPINNDRSMAIHAVIEGDATLVQRLWMQTHLTQDEINRLAAGSGASLFDQAPLIVQKELLFPYDQGFSFVLDTWQRAGGFSGVDSIYQSPPDSTEQVLHPEKYRTRERPIDVTLADLSPALGAGWRQIDANVFGEFDTRILLEEYGDPAASARAAAGWGGDRWQLLENNGRPAMVMRFVWDTDNDAGEFFTAYSQGLARRFQGATVEAATSIRQALTTQQWATDVRRDGREVLVAISFDRASANGIVAAVNGS